MKIFEIEFYDEDKSMSHLTPKFRLYSTEEEVKLSAMLAYLAIWIDKNPRELRNINEIRLIKGIDFKQQGWDIL